MSTPLIFISGASSGIGHALAVGAPWEDATIVDISRSGPRPDATGVEHLAADLSDPASWEAVGSAFRERIAAFDGDRVAFIHCAGTLTPIGFAGEVEAAPYTTNVVLNSAAPQVLGHHFLAAVEGRGLTTHLWFISSGAASSPYEGWSSYGAGKAATDQWVRSVGEEQRRRGGCQVLSVAPGVVATDMQEQIRATPERDFPKRDKFVALHEEGRLRDAADVAKQMWSLVDREDLPSGSVIDLRHLDAAGAS